MLFQLGLWVYSHTDVGGTLNISVRPVAHLLNREHKMSRSGREPAEDIKRIKRHLVAGCQEVRLELANARMYCSENMTSG